MESIISQLKIAESRGLIESVFIFDNNTCYHTNRSVIAIVYFLDKPDVIDLIEKIRSFLLEKYNMDSKYLYNKCQYNYIEPKLYIYKNNTSLK